MVKRTSRRLTVTALFAAGALAAAATGIPAPASAAPTPAASGSIVLYSAQGYDQTMSTAFTSASGIKVKLTDDSTGPTVARIEAERNNPKWDVVWFDGDATMQSLNNLGLLYKWTAPLQSNFTTLGRSLIPADHAFYPTGVTAAGVIVYNTHKLTAAQAPRDWSDLAQPRFKGLVAENDPAYSGPAYQLISGMLQRMGGITQGEAYYARLKANGLKIFQTNEPTVNAVQTGAVEVGIVQDTVYYKLHKKGAPLGIVYPRSGVTVLPSVIAINARSPHLAQAKAFVAYILSHAGQVKMVNSGDSDSYFVPVISGVAPLPGRRTTGINFQPLDYKFAGRHASEIKTWFHSHIVAG